MHFAILQPFAHIEFTSYSIETSDLKLALSIKCSKMYALKLLYKRNLGQG